MLNGEVPGFDVGILEVRIDREICLCLEGVGDDAVIRYDRLNQVRESILESGSLSAWQQRRAERSDRGIELIVRADGKVVCIAIVREGCEADAEPSATASLID